VVDPFHWIEQVTGFDPDGGSGILEAALLLVVATIASSYRVRALFRRERGKSG
jgi:hypothetical protein